MKFYEDESNMNETLGSAWPKFKLKGPLVQRYQAGTSGVIKAVGRYYPFILIPVLMVSEQVIFVSGAQRIIKFLVPKGVMPTNIQFNEETLEYLLGTSNSWRVVSTSRMRAMIAIHAPASQITIFIVFKNFLR